MWYTHNIWCAKPQRPVFRVPIPGVYLQFPCSYLQGGIEYSVPNLYLLLYHWTVFVIWIIGVGNITHKFWGMDRDREGFEKWYKWTVRTFYDMDRVYSFDRTADQNIKGLKGRDNYWLGQALWIVWFGHVWQQFIGFIRIPILKTSN